MLETTPGVTVSGTALASTFGTVDARGRGSLGVTDFFDANNGYKLGVRLGDCTATSKALTTAAILADFDRDAEKLAKQSAELFVSDEAREGMLAFLQKRQPNWNK